jgi:hypothetical protein
MQAAGRGAARPPIGIALIGDLGTRLDTLLGVAMLNGFATKTEARSISLCITTSSLRTAQLADVVASFYASRPPGTPSTIGVLEGPPQDDVPPLAAALTENGANGAARYKSASTRLLDTPDSAVLIRNVLLAQHDGNACIVLAGQATGLAQLLALYGSRPQIAVKARQLIVAVGSFPTGAPDASLKKDVAAARRVFAEWPTPIVAVGAEVGAALPYPGASIEKDFAWAPAHPVADAYRAFKPMPYDASAPALAAILYAVHPDANYFKLSEPGTISVQDDGRTQFAPSADGRHRYLIVDPAQKDRVIELYTAMVSARPAPRPGRGGGAL